MTEEVPVCPECKIDMRKRPTTSGYKWICDNYHKCGQSQRIKFG